MGEYASLYINGYEVDSWKNSIGEGTFIFSEEDATQTPRPYYGGDESDEGDYEDDEDEGAEDVEGDGEEHWRGYQYRNTACNIIDRLEVMGFTLGRAREWFEMGVAEEIREAKECSARPPLEGDLQCPPWSPFHPKAVKHLEGYTFDLWSGLIKDVLERRLGRIPFNHETGLMHENPYLAHILERSHWSELGFPGHGGMHMYCTAGCLRS